MSELKMIRCDCCGGDVQKISETEYRCLSCDMVSTIYSGELQTRLQIALDHRLGCQFDRAIATYKEIAKNYSNCGGIFWTVFIGVWY